MLPDLHPLPLADLWSLHARLLGELQAVAAELRARQDGAVLVEVRAVRALLERQEQVIGIEELAQRLGDEPGKLRQKLKRPGWQWLRDLGDKHRVGGRRRWLWSEVERVRAGRD